jgi:hypothetical protein
VCDVGDIGVRIDVNDPVNVTMCIDVNPPRSISMGVKMGNVKDILDGLIDLARGKACA